MKRNGCRSLSAASDTILRTGSSKGHKAITGRDCVGCLGQLRDTYNQLHRVFMSGGKSDQKAAALADQILKLQEKSK